MKHLFLLMGGAMLLMAGECSPPAELASPLSEPGQAPYDERLVGDWINGLGRDNKQGTAAILLRIRAHPNGFLVVDYGEMSIGREEDVWRGKDYRGGSEFFWARRTAFASVIDGETYYNFRLVDAFSAAKEVGADRITEIPKRGYYEWFTPHPERGYWIVHAELEKSGACDVLAARYLAVDDLEDMDLHEKTVSCGEDCEFTKFDLSPEELADRFRRAHASGAKPDDLLSEEFFRFVRIDDLFGPGGAGACSPPQVQ